jgi:hypothetical protein
MALSEKEKNIIGNFFLNVSHKYEKYKYINNLMALNNEDIYKRILNNRAYYLADEEIYKKKFYDDEKIYDELLYDFIMIYALKEYLEIIEFNIIDNFTIFKNLNKSDKYKNLNIPSETIINFDISWTPNVTDKKKFIYLYYIMFYKMCCLEFHEKNECIPLFDEVLSLAYDLKLFNEAEYNQFLLLGIKIDFSNFKITSEGENLNNIECAFFDKYALFHIEDDKNNFLSELVQDTYKMINGKYCYFINYANFLKFYLRHVTKRFSDDGILDTQITIETANINFYTNYPDASGENSFSKNAYNDFLFTTIKNYFDLELQVLKDFYEYIIKISELKYISSNIDKNHRFYLTFGVLVITQEYNIAHPDKTILKIMKKILDIYRINFRHFFPKVEYIKIVNVYELINILLEIDILDNKKKYMLEYNLYHMEKIGLIKTNLNKNHLLKKFKSLSKLKNINLLNEFTSYKNKFIILIFYLMILGIDILIVNSIISLLYYSNEINFIDSNKNFNFVKLFKDYIIDNILSFEGEYNFDETIYNDNYFKKSDKTKVKDVVTFENKKLIPLISLIEISAGIDHNTEISYSERKKKLIKHFIKYFNAREKPEGHDYLVNHIFPKFNNPVLSEISHYYYYRNITIYI